VGEKATTPQRVLEASRRLFIRKGYAATSLAEIAAEAGISQGNLTYHFPSKQDLATGILEDARRRMQARRAAYSPGPVADDYVEHLQFAMTLTWDYRFALRDRAQFMDEADEAQPVAEMAADFEELSSLLQRMKAEGFFRRDLAVGLPALARSLWIVSRYWLDHLGEFEGIRTVTWHEQERGIEQHLTLLAPCLTATARRSLDDALRRAANAPCPGNTSSSVQVLRGRA